MKRILRYDNRKQPARYWDVTTRQLEAGAILALFQHLDRDWGVYADLLEPESPPQHPLGHPDGCRCADCKAFRQEDKEDIERRRVAAEQLALYREARKGNLLSIRTLLEGRKTYEYETWTFETVESPKPAKYPKLEWGEKKPCLVALIEATGLVRYERHGAESFRMFPSAKEARKSLRERGFKVSSMSPQKVGPWKLISPILADYPKEVALASSLQGTELTPGRCIRMIRQWCEPHYQRFVRPFEK